MKSSAGATATNQTLLQTMTAEQYASQVIQTAKHNGMNLEQIKNANLWDLTHAHYLAQLKAIEEAGKKMQK